MPLGSTVVDEHDTQLGQGKKPTCKLSPDKLVAPAAVASDDKVGGTATSFVGVKADGVFVYIPDSENCKTTKKITWEEYWTILESQDAVNFGALTIDGSVEIEGLQRSRRANLGNGTRPAKASAPNIFIVSLANSKTNSDSAILVAAAKFKNPKKLTWNMFRIQLTHVADGGHFCTPSSTASVSTPVVGSTPAGRLFVAFNSLDGFTTYGSVLDFDSQSLRNGTAVAKCFTGEDTKNLVPPNVFDKNRTAYFVGISTLVSISRFSLKVEKHQDVADDDLVATPDINIPFFNFNPAAVQPNGFHLYSGDFAFHAPSVQIGKSLWNVHQIGDDGGHEKVRLYKLDAAATDPLMLQTLSTLGDQSDDTFAPSVATDSDLPGTEAFVTFSRTIVNDSVKGNATLMMARGPNDSATGWTSTILAKSKGQFDKNIAGQPCDSFQYGGCAFGPHSGTKIDTANNLVWGWGELITDGDLGIGGQGNEVNWLVEGVGIPR
ncbi:MAG: hypothetical protein JO056_07670 [Alphaproteobacteria bacterium]|nr:hypothetical protein [Alphaproteobacteria bacterium]